MSFYGQAQQNGIAGNGDNGPWRCQRCSDLDRKTHQNMRKKPRRLILSLYHAVARVVTKVRA